jgi:hypothetical protein
MEVKPGTCIYVLDDVISDEFCETLKIVVENVNGIENNNYKDGQNVLSKTVFINNTENIKFAKFIDGEIHKIVTDIIIRILKINPEIIALNGDSGYQLRKIHGATRHHTDSIFDGNIPDSINPKVIRKMSLIIALNSDYEGGEFYFPHQNVKVKLKKGQAILFPPYWTHPHSTGELNGTFRYTINTWLLE